MLIDNIALQYGATYYCLIYYVITLMAMMSSAVCRSGYGCRLRRRRRFSFRFHATYADAGGAATPLPPERYIAGDAAAPLPH